MTTKTTAAMTGTVENGYRAMIEVPNYTGMAGIKETTRGIEIAYVGRPPTGKMPKPGIVDSKPVTITEAGKSTVVPSMASLLAQWVNPPEPEPAPEA
jgi:hypothetical protein